MVMLTGFLLGAGPGEGPSLLIIEAIICHKRLYLVSSPGCLNPLTPQCLKSKTQTTVISFSYSIPGTTNHTSAIAIARIVQVWSP